MMRLPFHPQVAQTPTPPVRRWGGFTLVELMIAMAIIVLLIGIAMPVFRVINGSRSQEGASNQVAAMLAQARNDAIGLQTPTGVVFYTNAAGQALMAEVQQVQFAAWSGNVGYPPGTYVTDSGGYYVCTAEVAPPSSTATANTNPSGDSSHWSLITGTAVAGSPGFTYLFDQIPNTDAQRFPTGVGTMAMTDPGANSAGTAYTQDRYLHVGMMLFDASGRLTATPYWMSQYGLIGTGAGYRAKSRDICQQQGTRITTGYNLTGVSPPTASTTPCTLSSSIGLVTFDGDAYASQGAPAGDTIIDGTTYGVASTAGTKAAAEAWLDSNGSPLLINRYNGTLLRSE